MSLLGYAIFSRSSWHEDSPRTFMVSLPSFVPVATPLHDETGEAIGAVVKVWPATRDGKVAARIRLTERGLCARPDLRAELLAHRVNIAAELTPTGRRLALVPQIDTQRIAAAHSVVRPLFPWLANVS